MYLDKDFCHGQVIRYLQDKRQRVVLACTIRLILGDAPDRMAHFGRGSVAVTRCVLTFVALLKPCSMR